MAKHEFQTEVNGGCPKRFSLIQKKSLLNKNESLEYINGK